MTDLHTHILPGMDDGSRSSAMSIEMLRMEAEQGAEHVLLTPHFYRDREEPESFLRRRAHAYAHLREKLDALPPQERSQLPALSLGAEVMLFPGIAEWPRLRDLAFSEERFLLVELPFRRWDNAVFDSLSNLISRTGIIPVIAHLDRYFYLEDKRRIRTLLDLGVPIQISASAVLRRLSRRRAVRFLQEQALLISDCHDPVRRPPNLGDAAAILNKTLGADATRRILDRTDRLF